jgi:hypothetical protein
MQIDSEGNPSYDLQEDTLRQNEKEYEEAEAAMGSRIEQYNLEVCPKLLRKARLIWLSAFPSEYSLVSTSLISSLMSLTSLICHNKNLI